MDNAASDEVTYRFAAFGARGTITLTREEVHTRILTYRGRWEQTIPLENLCPRHGTLKTVPGLYIWSWILAAGFVGLGVYGVAWGLAPVPHGLWSLFLLASGAYYSWHLFRNRKAEWIMFSANDGGRGVCYTRQGPDRRQCDDFTQTLVDAIRSHSPPKIERNQEVHPIGGRRGS
jgi:hypothetical protein